MKIPLNMGQNGKVTDADAVNRVMEKDILSAQKGDWNAKHALERLFTPLLTSLAEKRTTDPVQVNRYIEAGKEGLMQAVRKYKSNVGSERFRIFALDFIEAGMNQVDKVGGGGFWARLFGR